MSATPDLQDRIARVFSGSLKLDIPSADTDLFESGVLDSLAFVELLLHLEREFGVTTSVDDLELDNFRTIGRIAWFVSARIGGAAGTPNPRVIELSSRR
ncbi:MAG TPA: acyl carrier protein [Vicinamibacterales bacterium]|nr:acyl carrier protein [Vicinamibacterales bacterium]